MIMEFGTVLNHKTARGDILRYKKVFDMKATAYTASFEETGKRLDTARFGLAGGAHRLVQIDQDGTRHVSSAVSVSLSVPSSEALNIYPNPVRRDRQSGIHLSNPFGEGGPVELTVFNHLGEEVFRKSFTDGGPIELPTGSLGAGAYFVLLRHQGVISTASFLVLD